MLCQIVNKSRPAPRYKITTGYSPLNYISGGRFGAMQAKAEIYDSFSQPMKKKNAKKIPEWQSGANHSTHKPSNNLRFLPPSKQKNPLRKRHGWY